MTAIGSYQIHTEARGPHWVAWITIGADTKPYRSVLLIAATQEEAETRAKAWAEQQQ
ncbi:MAG TPA: hypothetical protein VH417_11505 [Vicinamibacterales bacterium]|jgi:hypothetical protein